MLLKAKHYLGTATPGELFEADFDESTLKRLLRLGAVERVASAERLTRADDEVPRDVPEKNEDEADNEDEEEEAADEAPEIDVTDGIIPASGPAKSGPAARKNPVKKAK